MPPERDAWANGGSWADLKEWIRPRPCPWPDFPARRGASRVRRSLDRSPGPFSPIRKPDRAQEMNIDFHFPRGPLRQEKAALLRPRQTRRPHRTPRRPVEELDALPFPATSRPDAFEKGGGAAASPRLYFSGGAPSPSPSHWMRYRPAYRADSDRPCFGADYTLRRGLDNTGTYPDRRVQPGQALWTGVLCGRNSIAGDLLTAQPVPGSATGFPPVVGPPRSSAEYDKGKAPQWTSWDGAGSNTIRPRALSWGLTFRIAPRCHTITSSDPISPSAGLLMRFAGILRSTAKRSRRGQSLRSDLLRPGNRTVDGSCTRRTGEGRGWADWKEGGSSGAPGRSSSRWREPARAGGPPKERRYATLERTASARLKGRPAA